MSPHQRLHTCYVPGSVHTVDDPRKQVMCFLWSQSFQESCVFVFREGAFRRSVRKPQDRACITVPVGHCSALGTRGQ